ncbi:MAG: hypothetical protein RLT05_19210 [Bauldia litoralis]
MADRDPPDWLQLADRIDALAEDLIAAAPSAGDDDGEMINLWARGLKHYAIQLRQTLAD